MKKKVFKVVGIVLAVVVAFIGIVLGVMAIQGKFKKQIIYPKELVFEKNNYVEINDDSPSSTHLHSFTLTGTNGSKTVNRKTCYIRFADSCNGESVFGNELITLCDQNFAPLQIETEGDFVGYYKINCNEPVYYVFNSISPTSAHYSRPNFGRVVLEAYDQTGMVKSNQLVFDVDRVVDEIKFQDADYETETDALTHRQHGYQQKTLQLGNSILFDFEVSPYYSLRPFSNKSESKVVELYYVEKDQNSGTMLEYRLIDSTFVSSVDFLTEDDGQINFIPTRVGNYQFVYAVFDSFEAEANAPTTEFAYQCVQNNMVYSILDVTVTSEKAERLAMSESTNLNFNLYEKDSLVLNSGAAGMRNDLRLTINDGNTSELYNTFEFNTNTGRFWSNSNIVFKTESGEDSISLTDYQKVGNNLRIGGQDYEINFGNITLKGGRLIESLTHDGKTYKATNGVAFIDNTDHLNLLRVGSYLDFVEKSDTGYQTANLNYNAKFTSRALKNSTCEIEVLALPEIAEGNKLHLMALIINSDGSYAFASKECDIIESPLEYTINQNVVLEVTYPIGIALYSAENFENIVSITGGAYTAGLLVTEQSDDGYSIDVLENCTYTINDTTYVLVGFIDNNGFINTVRAKNLAKSPITTVYLMQVKNAYLQSAEEYVNEKIANGEGGGFAFAQAEVVAVYTDRPITVTNKYDLVDNLVYNFNESTEYELGEEGKDQHIIKTDNCYHILENTDGHTISISSPYEFMLSNIAGRLTKADFACYILIGDNYQHANDALTISDEVTIVDDIITISFKANSYDRIDGKFVLGFVYNEKFYHTPEIQIDSQAATGIMFKLGDTTVQLPIEEDAADIPTITATITGIKEGEYTFEYSYNNGGAEIKPIEDLNALFNRKYPKTSANQDGFVPFPAYSLNGKKNYSFDYSSQDNSILTISQTDGDTAEINILKIGTGLIMVRCNNTESIGYIKIEITSSDFVFKPKEPAESDDFKVNIKDNGAEVTTSGSQLSLDSFVEYSIGGIIQTSAKFFKISNVRCASSNYISDTTQDGDIVITDLAGNLYATISSKTGKWIIQRTRVHSNFNLSFDVSVATAPDSLSINVQFNSAISIELNSSYNATIYAGTNVLLVELLNLNANPNQKYNYNSLFRISETSTTTNYFKISYKEYKENSSEDDTADETVAATYFAVSSDTSVKIDKTGYYVFSIYSSTSESGENETVLETFNLIVKPNVVFSQKSENEVAAHALVSNEERNLSDLVRLEKYKIDVTYGLDAAYDADNLIAFDNTDYANLQFDNNEYKEQTILTPTEGNTKVKILWLDDLDEVVNKTIKLRYDSTEFDLSVYIINKYKADIVINDTIQEFNGDEFVYSARKFATAPISIEGVTLIGVSGQDFQFEVDEENQKFKLSQDLQDRVSASLTFTYEVSIAGQNYTLIYKNTGNTTAPNISIILTPRTPDMQNVINAISNSQFDIIKGVFAIKDNGENEDEEGDGVSSIEVVAVTNSQIYDSQVVGVKYVYGETTNNTIITFKEISGAEQTSTVTYKITYIGGDVYNHNVVITVKNRQTIEIHYPYAGFETNIANYFYTLTNDSATIEYINGIENSFMYEPVNVGQTITFGSDSRRVEIFENASKVENQISSVEWVAYTNTRYNEMVSIDENGHNFRITFNLPRSINSAYAVLKITSVSGNYKFYNVSIYNQTISPNSANTNSNLTWQINVDGIDDNAFYSKEVNSNGGYTYKILGVEFSDSKLSQYFKLQSVMPNDNNFKLYLLESKILSGNNLNPYETLELNQFELLNGKTLKSLPQFTTLKIALIYIGNGASSVIYLGNIEVYAKSNKGVSTKPSGVNEPEISTKINGIENGEYVCSWLMSNESTFTNPFSFTAGKYSSLSLEIRADGFDISDDGLMLDGKPIITLSQQDGTITRTNFVRHAYQFDVIYTFTFDDDSRLVLLVTFNMGQTNVPTDSQNYNVGYDVTKQAFVNEKEIWLLGYTGNIKIYVDGVNGEPIEMHNGSVETLDSVKNITANYSSGTLTLHFNLPIAAYNFGFRIEYSGIIGFELSCRVNVEVDSAAFVYFPSAANGSNSSSPYTANFVDTTFSSKNASSIQIIRNENTFSLNDPLNELKIFAGDTAAQLDFEYSDSDLKFITLRYGEVDTDNLDNKICFAHSARDDVIVEIIIKIKNGNSYYTDINGAPKTAHLYIKVPQTYLSLQAIYSTNGAEHENVLSGQTISAIRANLFGAQGENAADVANSQFRIYNGSKIEIIDLEKNHYAKDLLALGFLDKNNANYINIDIHTDSLVKRLNTNVSNENDQDLIFPEITANTPTTISLSNDAGVIGLSYRYQIMKDIRLSATEERQLLDGATAIDAKNQEYICNTTYADNVGKTVQTIDYSFIVNKQDSAAKFATNPLAIATLIDENNTAFYIKNINVTATSTLAGGTLSLSNGTRADNDNTIIYTLEYSNYTLIIKRTANMQIEVELRNESSTDEILTFDITFVGNGGEFKLCLNFYNCTLNTPEEQEQAAGFDVDINLSEIIKSNVENGSAFDGVTFEYEQNGSFVDYLKNHYTNLSATNDYFSLEISANKAKVHLYTIKENATINIRFKVILNDKIIGYFNQFILDNCAYKFVLQDGHIIVSDGASYAENYYLWLSSPNAVNEENSVFKLINLMGGVNEQPATYNLNDQLYNDRINISLLNNDSPVGIESISITIVDENGEEKNSPYCTIVKGLSTISLNFNKDFTGKIILKLSARTINGQYDQYLALDVLGYITLKYSNNNNQNTILSTVGGNGYDSGKEVRLIDTSSVEQTTGLVISTTKQDSDKQDVKEELYANITPVVNYVIVPYQSNLDVAKACADGKKTALSLEPDIANNIFTLKHNLPTVPMSTQDNYVVIYCVQLAYLGLDETVMDKYYVAYKVHNDVKLTPKSAPIDADDLAIANSAKPSALRLFEYSITYTVDGKNYIVYCDINGELHLKDDSSSNMYNDYIINGNEIIFTDKSNNTIKIDNVSIERPNVTITQSGKESKTSIASRTISSGADSSNIFFSLNYRSILEFKNFITNSYIRLDADQNSNYVGQENKHENLDAYTDYLYYKIISLTDGEVGLFGIDLMQPYKSATFAEGNELELEGKLFNNEFNCALNIMDKTSNSSILKTNLQLTTKNALTANGYTLNEMFKINNPATENYKIIGIGNAPDKDWIEPSAQGLDTTCQDGTLTTTVNYMGTIYNVYSATWSRTSNGIYGLTQVFYYIHTDSTSIVTVNFNSGDSTLFIVEISAFADSLISVEDKICEYVNAEGGMQKVLKSASEFVAKADEGNNDFVTFNNNITASWENLVKYKNLHPSENFLKIQCDLKYSIEDGETKTFTVQVYFKLLENASICLTSQELSGEFTINLLDEKYNLTIPTADGYVNLKDNLSLVSTLDEKDTNYATISQNETSLSISIKQEEINDYFTKNSTSSNMKISFTLTTTSKTEITIDVIIQKPQI